MSCPPGVPASGIAARSAAVLACALLAVALLQSAAVALSAGDLVTGAEELPGAEQLPGAEGLPGGAGPASALDELPGGEESPTSEQGPLLGELSDPLEQLPAALEQTTGAIEGAAEALPLPEDPPLLHAVSPSSSLRLSGTADAASEPLPGAPATSGEPSSPAAEDPAALTTPAQPATPEEHGLGTAGVVPPPVTAVTGVGVQAAGLQPLGVLAADAARQFALPLLVMVAVAVFLAAGGQLAPHDRKALARSSDDVGRAFS